MPNERPKLLSVTEAAQRLGIHPHTLRAWADKGLVPVMRTPTGYRRFDPDALDQVIEAMQSGKLVA
ncbi:MAG: MerR family DNA-binding transcriptional regulator [Thermomicrobiales bacterium]